MSIFVNEKKDLSDIQDAFGAFISRNFGNIPQKSEVHQKMFRQFH